MMRKRKNQKPQSKFQRKLQARIDKGKRKWARRTQDTLHPIASTKAYTHQIQQDTIKAYKNGEFEQQYTPTQGAREMGHSITHMSKFHMVFFLIIVALLITCIVFNYLG